jgi:Caspase domain
MGDLREDRDASRYHSKGDYDQAIRVDVALTEARDNRERARAALAAPSTPAKPPAAVSQPASPPAIPAAPERRVALVIGNSGYRSVPVLQNPRRDAAAVANALRQVGFQTVELATDLDCDGMVKALRSFRAQADHADWVLVYFAGHGVEIVRDDVLEATHNRQQPYTYGSLPGRRDFYFVAGR